MDYSIYITKTTIFQKNTEKKLKKDQNLCHSIFDMHRKAYSIFERALKLAKCGKIIFIINIMSLFNVSENDDNENNDNEFFF